MSHLQAELRRRRLDAKIRLLVVAGEVLDHPEHRVRRDLFREAVRVSFADGVTIGQISKLTGWSEAAIRKEMSSNG